MKILEGCRWVPRWVAHLGCVKGCLDFLGIPISDPWLYGGTGHAFVLNLHKEVCPSGPTAWHSIKLFELGRNLGYAVDGIFALKSQPDFAGLQRQAFDHVRQAIDRGLPCYGWELAIPEFYVVYGYDDVGYYFQGPGADEGQGPKPWQEMGDTGIGVLELYSVAPGAVASDELTVRQALSFALELAESPNPYVREPYTSGLRGYDAWIAALGSGKASDMGTRYNAGVWLECRRNAAGFLMEARERLHGRADAPLTAAAEAYGRVAAGLEAVAELYPWEWDASDEVRLPVDDVSRAAVEALRVARAAEAEGIAALRAVLAAL